jgi:integrating conjugative element protein (TIGR03761 family)
VLEGIEQARLELSQLDQEIQQRLQRIQGIEIQVAQSSAPLRMPLRFATPYGYMGAYLIADYDQLVCSILTAQHLGVLSRDSSEALMQRSTRLIRRVFTTPLGWKPLAVTREEVRTNSPRAQQARDQLGELPADILAGTRRAQFAPALPNTSVGNDKASKGHAKDQDQGDQPNRV